MRVPTVQSSNMWYVAPSLRSRYVPLLKNEWWLSSVGAMAPVWRRGFVMSRPFLGPSPAAGFRRLPATGRGRGQDRARAVLACRGGDGRGVPRPRRGRAGLVLRPPRGARATDDGPRAGRRGPRRHDPLGERARARRRTHRPDRPPRPGRGACHLPVGLVRRPRVSGRYCWTSVTGLPSGSVIPAIVGPPGTSKAGMVTAPPSASASASDAV